MNTVTDPTLDQRDATPRRLARQETTLGARVEETSGMKRNSLPAPVLSKLIELDEQTQFLSRKIDDTERAIANARMRLTGRFEQQEEPNDLRKALDAMIADLPVIERRCVRTRHTVSRCKDFLDKLSDDAVLEPVEANVNGHDLRSVQARLKAADDELKLLRQVPTPSNDIEQRIERYCTEMARPNDLRHRQAGWKA